MNDTGDNVGGAVKAISDGVGGSSWNDAQRLARTGNVVHVDLRRLAGMVFKNVTVNQSVEEFREGSVAAAARDAIEMIQVLLQHQIDDLIRPLGDYHADVNIGQPKNRLRELLVQFERIFLSAVRVYKQKQPSRPILET